MKIKINKNYFLSFFVNCDPLYVNVGGFDNCVESLQVLLDNELFVLFFQLIEVAHVNDRQKRII